MKALLSLLVLLCILSLVNGSPVHRYNVSSITVSGLSSGAFFAVQMHVAFSSMISGAGIVAGGPFYCAQDSEIKALTECTSDPLLLDLNELYDATSGFVSAGSIDDTSNLVDAKVYLYSGTLDYIVNQGVVKALYSYYQHYVTSGTINTEFSVASGHAMITDDYGNTCMLTESPWINNCAYDAAENIFTTVLGKTLNSAGTPVSDNLISFSQSNFTGGNPSALSMGPDAYMYVPTACQSGRDACDLHIAFHGCLQNIPSIGTVFVTDTEYNGWAESNNIIVVYPQVITSELTNPDGCWDWWGYLGSNYAVQDGDQMQAIHKMITALSDSDNIIRLVEEHRAGLNY